MSAHKLYELFVGEIGYDEHRFLLDLKQWQINSIIRGFRRRERTSWYQTRWSTWVILKSLGSKIELPEDLLPLPFDETEETQIDKEEEARQLQKLLEECREENRRTEERKQGY